MYQSGNVDCSGFRLLGLLEASAHSKEFIDGVELVF